uniref:Uncharacterized protein n=2 Tax=Coronaviridae TaxID=11118 RepID=F1DAY8_9ALPC|nr:hypothetical protein ORFx [Chaerephon bat coronavirus/Kenya/KY41/2006]
MKLLIFLLLFTPSFSLPYDWLNRRDLDHHKDVYVPQECQGLRPFKLSLLCAIGFIEDTKGLYLGFLKDQSHPTDEDRLLASLYEFSD